MGVLTLVTGVFALETIDDEAVLLVGVLALLFKAEEWEVGVVPVLR